MYNFPITTLYTSSAKKILFIFGMNKEVDFFTNFSNIFNKLCYKTVTEQNIMNTAIV